MAKLTKELSFPTALCCTWGDDARLIAAACHAHGLPMPMRTVLDLAPFVQSLFLLKQTAGLRAAVEILGLTFEGVPHGALPDARNTALVHAAVLRRIRRIADPTPLVYPTEVESQIPSEFGRKLARALTLVD